MYSLYFFRMYSLLNHVVIVFQLIYNNFLAFSRAFLYFGYVIITKSLLHALIELPKMREYPKLQIEMVEQKCSQENNVEDIHSLNYNTYVAIWECLIFRNKNPNILEIFTFFCLLPTLLMRVWQVHICALCDSLCL